MRRSLNKIDEKELFIILHVIIQLKNWNYFSDLIQTNSLQFVKIKKIPKNFISFTKWIDNNYKTNEIKDFSLLIDMYKNEIMEVVGEYTYISNLCPVLICENHKWQLKNQKNLPIQYSSLTECKKHRVTQPNISQIPHIIKNLNKVQSDKMKKLLKNKHIFNKISLIADDMSLGKTNEFYME